MIDINNIKKLIALGYQAFKQKNYEQAIKVWQPMIDFCQNEKFSDSDKEIANTYLDLGKCYYRTQQYHKAKTVINRGLNNFPNDLNLLKLEGFNEEKLNNHELALQAWKKVLEQYPKHIEAEQHIRDIRKQIEKKQQQEQYLIRQKEISVDLQKVLLDIDESIKQGLCQDEQIEKYFAEFPNNYQLLLKYAQNAQDNYTKLQRFITLTQLYPYSEEALFELLEVYEEEKQFRQAKLFWQSFTKKNLNIDYSLYKLYAEKVEKHEPREAFFRWLEVYRQFPTYIEVTKKIDSLGKQLKLQKYCGTKNIASQQILSEQHQVSQMFLSGKKAFDAKNYHESNQIWTIHNDDINDFCDDIIKKLDNDFLKEIAFEQNSIKEYYCLVELAVSKTCLDNPKIWIFDNHTIVVDCMIGKYSLGMDFIIKSSYLKCEIFTRYENIDVEQINDFFNAKILNAHRIEYCNHAISNEELIEKEIVSIIEKFSYFIMTLASHITKQKLEELYNIYQQKNYQLFIDGSESLLSKNQLDIIQKQSLLEKLADSYKCVKQIGKSIQTYHVLIDSGKQNQNIYETLANLYEHNKEFHKSIQTWEIVAEKFPKSVFAFWSIGNIYKNHLKDYDKAIEMYQKQIGRFPERKSGYQGLAESLYDAKRYEEALIAWEHIKQKYPDEPKSYWTIGQIYKATEQSELAEKTFLELINNFPNRESGYWNMAMLKFNLQRWADAKYYWEQYFNKFSANEDVYFNYLKILINLNQDNIGFCETIAKKTGKNIQDILLKYVLFLRNYNKFSQLENVSYQLIGEYPKVSQFAEMYFIALYCQKKWLLAKNAYHQLINKFDIKLNDVTYTYLDVLWHLKQHDDLEIFYLKMLKKTYPQILKYYPSYDFSLDKIAIAETVGNFKESDKLRQSYIPLIDIQFVNKPAFDETIECEYIHHSDNNKALLIFFSGLTFKIKNNFDKHGFENFEQLKEDNKEIKSSFIRFAQKNTQYNMLMINDIYNSWEQLHKMEYLNYIKKTIDKYKPKTVVCVGVSSGGYAAMLYGQLIKANLVFAFSPQTIPFFNYANYLGHLYRNHFSLGMQAEDSVIRLQNQQGFYAKTYIIVSKYNGMDLIGLNQLDMMDKNLLITYCKSYEHVPIQGLGVKNVYSEMCRVIDIMIESNNQSPIVLDIFLKFPTFDHNSYQNNSY